MNPENSVRVFLTSRLTQVYAVHGSLSEDIVTCDDVFDGPNFNDSLEADVGGQHCPDSVRIYCAVSVGQNQVQIRS